MPKNRNYTWLERTPPSMAWLIRSRSILKGQLDQCRKQLDAPPRQIVELEAKLKALDEVFSLHDVKVDPTVVKGRQPRQNCLLPYGTLTKGILRALKGANGKSLHTSTIAAHIAVDTGLDLTRKNRAHVADRASNRLEAMVKISVVQRHHNTAIGENGQGVWSLSIEDQDAFPARQAA